MTMLNFGAIFKEFNEGLHIITKYVQISLEKCSNDNTVDQKCMQWKLV